MKRLVPFLIFVLVAGGLAAYIYKDKLLPQDPSAQQDGGGKNASGGEGRGGDRNNAAGGGGRGNRRRPDVVPVLVDKVHTDQVPVYLTGVGTVQAFNTATIRAQVSGRLTEVNFKEGQDVKKGDVLARIDPVLYQAAYDQAVAKKATDQALLENAQRDAKRYTGLAKSDYSSQQQADTAVATVHQYEGMIGQDQASIDNAKANLDYATVRAPFDGRTGLRLVDMGNLVSSTDATGVVVITQLQPISVVFTLPEDNVAPVLQAQALSPLPLQALTNGTVIGDGNLQVIDNQIDQSTGSFKLKGTFGNEGFRLWPGQFVNVKLRLKVLENAIVVPTVAIQQGANGSYVYVVTQESKVKLTPIKIVLDGEKQTVVSEGVAVGDQVVISGFTNLNDGVKVRIDTPSASASDQNSNQAQGQSGQGQNQQGQNQTDPATTTPADNNGDGHHHHHKHGDDGNGNNGDTDGQKKDWKSKKKAANPQDGHSDTNTATPSDQNQATPSDGTQTGTTRP